MSATPFGRYLLLERIAQGGMAQVFRAFLRQGNDFEKQVAVKKILRAYSDDPEFVARFIDEARIASTLNHSNIIQVFDFGKIDGQYYIAMELIEGVDLGALIISAQNHLQPIPIPAALFVVAAVARGLGAAHARRDAKGQPTPVIHRDISPQNILLSYAGEIKIADFGIAKAAERIQQTRTGLVLGKCHYMAPEQAAGEAVDVRADIFSLGCVFFELLTGHRLFDGSSPEQVLQNVLRADIPLPSGVNPHLPPEIDDIFSRSLDRDPQGRYSDGNALARDLEQLLHRLAPDYCRDDFAALTQALCPRVALAQPQTHLKTTAVASTPAANDETATNTDNDGPAQSSGPATLDELRSSQITAPAPAPQLAFDSTMLATPSPNAVWPSPPNMAAPLPDRKRRIRHVAIGAIVIVSGFALGAFGNRARLAGSTASAPHVIPVSNQLLAPYTIAPWRIWHVQISQISPPTSSATNTKEKWVIVIAEIKGSNATTGIKELGTQLGAQTISQQQINPRFWHMTKPTTSGVQGAFYFQTEHPIKRFVLQN